MIFTVGREVADLPDTRLKSYDAANRLLKNSAGAPQSSSAAKASIICDYLSARLEAAPLQKNVLVAALC
jgi:hypothetical protein